MDKIHIEIRINRGRDSDLELEALIDDLTQKRTLSSVVRASVPLMADLQAGRLDVLFSLFPHLRAQFVQDTVLDKARYDCELLERLVDIAAEVLLPPAYYRVVQQEVQNGD